MTVAANKAPLGPALLILVGTVLGQLDEAVHLSLSLSLSLSHFLLFSSFSY